MKTDNVNLHSLASNTDKSYDHQYIHVYESLFTPIRKQVKNMLEIGIWQGDSHKMWRDYFDEAQIYGIDTNIDSCRTLDNQERILAIHGNAYSDEIVDLFKDVTFDVIVDDGPHTLQSQIECVKFYAPLLSANGILVIEDIPHPEWISLIASSVPPELQMYMYGIDRRIAPNRHSINDELMFVIDKRYV